MFHYEKKIESQFQLKDAFVTEILHSALDADALADTHPMSNPEVHSPDDIGDMFDTISYKKGSSVVRMLQHTLGNEQFFYGLRKYLKAK